LDRDSEGLVLLTNDGMLQHRWSDPRFHQPKKYWAQVEGIPHAESIEKLCAGVKLKDGITKPARALVLEPSPEVPERVPPIRYRAAIPTAWLELVLTEGRNRQVRRMTAAVGFPTLRLLRVAIGELELTGLAPGEWKEISRP
jgi:23S rRNA pseudouridine2457 synthase